MQEAMFSASVGDDVFGEDPSVNALQQYAADMFAMEASLFCPSGTMTNQIAIKCHTQPGDEVICDKTSHVYIYEGGGVAFNSGCQVRPLVGDRGRINSDLIVQAINPDDVHKAKSRLVSLEDTSNLGGGSCYDMDMLSSIKKTCDDFGLVLHLDGARLFNAIVEKDQKPSDFGALFDSISVCLSKGLGAPVGSLLLGSEKFIQRAKRIRKVFGGGMRQAGYMAAAGLYAMKNNIERLHLDHIHAKQIAEALLKKSFVGRMLPVETNIILFELLGDYTAAHFTEELKQHGILVIPVSRTQVRMVLHLDITEEMVSQTIEVIERF